MVNGGRLKFLGTTTISSIAESHVRTVRIGDARPPTLKLAAATKSGTRTKLNRWFLLLQSACTMTDSSYVVVGPDNCGTKTWDLRATASDGTILDEGYFQSFGACKGNYDDCNGVWQQPSDTGSERRMASASQDNGTGVRFGWYLDNWQQAVYSPCSDCDPDPAGLKEDVEKLLILTTYWIYYCQ